MVKGPGLYSKGNNLLPPTPHPPTHPLSSRLLSCHLDEWLIRRNVKRIMIWSGRGGASGDGRGGGSLSISGTEILRRGHIVGWHNTGQEESILLTVKIHLVKHKRSQRPGCSDWPHPGPAPSSWRRFSLKTPSLAFSALMRTLKVIQWEDLQVLFSQRGSESLNELSLGKSGDEESGELHILVQVCEDLCGLEIQR